METNNNNEFNLEGMTDFSDDFFSEIEIVEDVPAESNTEVAENTDKEEETPIEEIIPIEGERDNNSSIASPLSRLSLLLKEQGILPSEITEDDVKAKGVEVLVEKFEEAINQKLEAHLESLPEDKYKTILDKVLKKLPKELKEIYLNYDEGLPVTQLLNIKAREIDMSKIDASYLDEDETLQENVLRHDLMLKGISKEDIDTDIDLYKENGLLKNKSLKALDSIKSHYSNEYNKEVDNATKLKKETEEKIKTYLSSLKTVAPEVPMNTKIQEAVLQSMNTKVRLENGVVLDKVRAKIFNDPVKYSTNLHILDHLGLLDLDWSKVGTKVKSNVVKEFEKSLDSLTSPLESGKRTHIKSNSDFDELIKMFDK